MPTRLLDTNVCIAVMRGVHEVTRRLAVELAHGDPRVSVITVYELIHGAARSGRTTEELAKISRFIEGGPQSTPFEWADAEAAGRVRATLARRGEMIGAYDILIAGQALARGWIVVTANSGEFARVEGLRLENWRP